MSGNARMPWRGSRARRRPSTIEGLKVRQEPETVPGDESNHDEGRTHPAQWPSHQPPARQMCVRTGDCGPTAIVLGGMILSSKETRGVRNRIIDQQRCRKTQRISKCAERRYCWRWGRRRSRADSSSKHRLASRMCAAPSQNGSARAHFYQRLTFNQEGCSWSRQVVFG